MNKKQIKRRVATANIAGLSPLLSRVVSGRGERDNTALDYPLAKLIEPASMLGLPAAVLVLADAIAKHERILIVGDFDADGATSTALMVSGLRAMGATSVDYLVPNRFEFGYGLTPEIVTVARARSPDLIITVDNGISSIDGVNYAKQCGIKVLITDHHLPADELPNADAIVNPNQKGCAFPSKNLAGCGVAFYLLTALRKHLRETRWFRTDGFRTDTDSPREPNLACYLDLVALGTIADVVSLDLNNRILVQAGLKRMRAGKIRPGIKALLDIAGKRLDVLTSTDLAFGVAPRLNAAGRLDDISLGIECLLTDDESHARNLAMQLDQLNQERREIEADMKQQALANIDFQKADKQHNDSMGLCLYEPDWHQGVVGIVASRIKEILHRPVIAFARISDTELKGSGRSIAGMHMRDALDSIAAKNPGLIVRFGGHAMAAGLSLPLDRYDEFKKEFAEEAKRQLSPEDLEHIAFSDGDYTEFNIPAIRALMLASPWGQSFPEPLFDSQFEIIEQRIVGTKHLKLKLRPIDSDQILDAIAFNQNRLLEGRQKQMAYRLGVNEYRGRESVQLIIDTIVY